MAPSGNYKCIDSFVMQPKIDIKVRRLASAHAMATVDVSKSSI